QWRRAGGRTGSEHDLGRRSDVHIEGAAVNRHGTVGSAELVGAGLVDLAAGEGGQARTVGRDRVRRAGEGRVRRAGTGCDRERHWGTGDWIPELIACQDARLGAEDRSAAVVWTGLLDVDQFGDRTGDLGQGAVVRRSARGGAGSRLRDVAGRQTGTRGWLN